jgi:hypothetical protein
MSAAISMSPLRQTTWLVMSYLCVCLAFCSLQGPTYTITVNGGECEILDDGSVECEPPFIELSETPFICNLPYREAAELEVSDAAGIVLLLLLL